MEMSSMQAFSWVGPYHRKIVYRDELSASEWGLVLKGKHPNLRLMPCSINKNDLLFQYD